MPRSTAGVVLWAAMGVCVIAGRAAGADAVTESPATPEIATGVVLPLVTAEPVPQTTYTADDLRQKFPAFKHAPYESSGFNHLMLPFCVLTSGTDNDASEALAFSFLLSNSLDWASGCYCTRHAYFAFKRSREEMTALSRAYKPQVVRDLIKEWDATHAVGGVLRRRGQTYAGELQVFDHTGKVVCHRFYTRYRDYFELLGDMAVEALRFFGTEPSAALVAHLHRKRCAHPESLIELGRAAFAPEKTPEEFVLYERILERDPGFADVRYWYANQRRWHDSDEKRYYLESGRALSDYLVENAVFDFSPGKCPDSALASKYPEWLQQAEELAGPGHPSVVTMRLREAVDRKEIQPEFLEKATQVAAALPNAYFLLYYLGKVYLGGPNLEADPDMAASIALCALESRYLTAYGDRDVARRSLGLAALNMGYDAVCVDVLKPVFYRRVKQGKPGETASDANWIATTLLRMGHSGQAEPLLATAVRGYDAASDSHHRVVLRRGVAAAHTGRTDLLETLIQEYRQELEPEHTAAILEAYRDLLAGKSLNPANYPKHPTFKSSEEHIEEEVLLGQMDLLAGGRTKWDAIRRCLKSYQEDRRFRILYDLYERQTPRDDDICFYEMLDWLYPDDPWARKAVAEFRQRRPGADLPADVRPESLLERLAEFEPVRWPRPDASRKKNAEKALNPLPPGAVATAVRRLLAVPDVDKAEELARRYLHAAANVMDFGLRAQASRLIHLVEQAKEKASAK